MCVIVPLQELLMTYIQIHMLFHAKALEIYTVAHHSLQLFNEDEALQASAICMYQSQKYLLGDCVKMNTSR